MPDRAVGHDHVVAEDTLERRADACQRVPRALVARVRLELDPIGVKRLEGVGQLEQLGLAVGAGPLEGRADPGPADLDAQVGHVDVNAGRHASDAAVDIEAAFASGRWYLLQARPITTGAPASRTTETRSAASMVPAPKLV